MAVVLRTHLVVPEVAGRGLPGELLDAGHVDRRHGPGASAGSQPSAREGNEKWNESGRIPDMKSNGGWFVGPPGPFP